MTTYYRITDQVLRDLTPEEFAALAQNKRDILRVYVIDAQPVPSATQVVVSAGLVVGPVEAHKTWALRDKTADELEVDNLAAEKAQLDNWLTDVQTQLALDNPARALLTNAQRINELEKDTRVLLKAAKRYIRQQKRAL
jgi:hypothetical protein